MDVNKLTLRSQEALQNAQRVATERNHQQVETAHLLDALLSHAEGVVFPLLQKLGASPRSLRMRLEGVFESVPKVYGQIETYLSRGLSSTLEAAFAQAEGLGDAYVSTEHLQLALLEQKDDVAALLAEAGVTRERVLDALKEIRGSQQAARGPAARASLPQRRGRRGGHRGGRVPVDRHPDLEAYGG
jgi:ATP-dependent Clp protease ATP-binding subunit ClpB